MLRERVEQLLEYYQGLHTPVVMREQIVTHLQTVLSLKEREDASPRAERQTSTGDADQSGYAGAGQGRGIRQSP